MPFAVFIACRWPMVSHS